jgi:ribulose-5-phosphate 4-epimerase/fuculose-1-phosphate aldolase
MSEREGVIKYHLEHRQERLTDDINIEQLNGWRALLYRLKLIGSLPDKYDGLGFGNISRRLAPDSDQFVITGTQTGHLPLLSLNDYALIQSASPQHNSIKSCGLRPPSSEALTHAVIYQHDQSIQSVFHVHSPDLWLHTEQLRLPHTAADIPYGTPQMAEAVINLFNAGALGEKKIFSMLGHEDGVVAFGVSVASAANCLLSELAQAIILETAVDRFIAGNQL